MIIYLKIRTKKYKNKYNIIDINEVNSLVEIICFLKTGFMYLFLCQKEVLIKLTSCVFIFTGDTQEECLGCGKTFLAFSASMNGRNFCCTCSKDASKPNSSDFSTKFPSYTTDSGSEESYATEAEDNEESQCEK